MQMRMGKKVWTGEEEVKLSKLLLAFWQRHGFLPSGSASIGFWQTVKARLAQRFTVKQINGKVATLRKRHLNISSGTARAVKRHEVETIPIWAKMLNYADKLAEDGEVPVTGGGEYTAEGVHGGACAHFHHPAEDTHAHREPGESWTPVSNDIMAEADNQGHAYGDYLALMIEREMRYAGAAGSWDDMARACGAEDDSSSCCIIEEEYEPEEVEEVEEVNEQHMEEAEGQKHDQRFNEEEQEKVEKEVEEEEDAAEQHNPAHNNYHAFSQGAASGLHAEQHNPAHNKYHAFSQGAASGPHADCDKQDLRMLNCLAIADLAAAVRTLAEVVKGHPWPTPA